MDWITIVFWLVGTLVVVLAPLILIHELGHFVFAKLAGVRAEEFGLGYPPRMLKLWRGKGYLEIDNTRVVIPVGFRLPPDLAVGTQVDVVAQQHKNGSYRLRHIQAQEPYNDTPVIKHESINEDIHIQGELAVWEPGTLYSLNWLPMGGFLKMTGEENPADPRSLAAQPKRWRLAVLSAGAVLNIIFAVLLLVVAYTSGVPEKWQVQITNIEPGSPAQEAGLQPRDIVTAVDEERIEEGMEHLRRIIRAAPDQNIELAITRGEETLTLAATPGRTDEGYGLLGILMAPWPDQSAVQHYTLSQALKASISNLKNALVMTVQVPILLIRGNITPQEARPASMVGISEILAFTLQQSIKWGLAFPVLETAALISLALGFTNLLPLPALDGGRIFFVLIEAVRGRRVAPEREAMFHFVGLVILVSLMAFVMLQDFVNPIIPWSMLK
ncbi:MAG: site-2 protease family protein [Chloroflexi bacterium]|nr:site-2 protease family protein [Chloroflexota bacterium]